MKQVEYKEIQSIKCVIVGNVSVGKTSLILESLEPGSTKDAEYLPTVYDNSNYINVINGKLYSIDLWDTKANGDFDRLRPLSYPRTDIFLVCFDVTNPESFLSIKTDWEPELMHHCPGVPKLLVGTKCDLRDSEEIAMKLKQRNLDFVSEKDARNLVSELGFCDYMETSSYLHINIDEIFVHVAMAMERVIHKTPKELRNNCLLM